MHPLDKARALKELYDRYGSYERVAKETTWSASTVRFLALVFAVVAAYNGYLYLTGPWRMTDGLRAHLAQRPATVNVLVTAKFPPEEFHLSRHYWILAIDLAPDDGGGNRSAPSLHGLASDTPWIASHGLRRGRGRGLRRLDREDREVELPELVAEFTEGALDLVFGDEHGWCLDGRLDLDAPEGRHDNTSPRRRRRIFDAGLLMLDNSSGCVNGGHGRSDRTRRGPVSSRREDQAIPGSASMFSTAFF